MPKKNIVILFGPSLENKNGFYGGGVGGYTRIMKTHLNCFKSEEFILLPCYHSIRQKGKLQVLVFPLRLLKDIYRLIKSFILYKPSVIHILGQYRTATPREYFAVLISKLFKKKIVYQIIAGVFIDFFNSANFIHKHMLNHILAQTTVILAEGKEYVDFLQKRYPEKKIFYFPAFIPVSEVPKKLKPRLSNQVLKILFVGYCYEGKGVFELIEGLNLAASKGLYLNLTLIGQESPEFKSWLNEYVCEGNFKINRRGSVDHQSVLEEMKEHDIYLYPSKHLGEGHNNSINEAMMNDMVIVTTRIGFLPHVLSDAAFFLDKVDSEEIARLIIYINYNKQEALERAQKAKRILMDHYTSQTQIPALISYYKTAINKNL